MAAGRENDGGGRKKERQDKVTDTTGGCIDGVAYLGAMDILVVRSGGKEWRWRETTTVLVAAARGKAAGRMAWRVRSGVKDSGSKEPRRRGVDRSGGKASGVENGGGGKGTRIRRARTQQG